MDDKRQGSPSPAHQWISFENGTKWIITEKYDDGPYIGVSMDTIAPAQPWLKPCPLCGGEAHQVGHVENGVITTWVIFCASCEIELTGDSDKIVAIWNAGAKE